jgi:fumarate hydratase subunit beta
VAVYTLRTPIAAEDAARLRIGDVIYVSGLVVTARDLAHKRLVEYLRRGERPPVDLNGGVVYHAGPVVRRAGDGWEVVSAGPTTSARMEPFEAEVIRKLGVKLVVGKGGMGRRTAKALRECGAAYAVFTGGAGVLAAAAVRRVVSVHWLDLGIADAMWVLDVESFGPLTVVIDSTGSNYLEEVRERAARKVPRVLESISWPFRAL